MTRTFQIVLFLLAPVYGAAPHYFATTAAGFPPSGSSPVALQQSLGGVSSVTYDTHGNLYYALFDRVFRLNADGTDTLVAGAFPPLSTSEGFISPYLTGIASDAQGNLYLAFQNYCAVYKVTPAGAVSTFAGTGQASPQPVHVTPGTPATSNNICPGDVTVDAAGTVYVADDLTYSLLAYPPDGSTTRVIAGNNGAGSPPVGSAVATAVSLFNPAHIQIVGSLVYFVANGTLQVVSLQTGMLSAVPNLPIGFNGAFAAAPDGSLYVSAGASVVKFNPQSGASVPTAGTGAVGFSGDGGLAAAADIASANSLAVNPVNGDLAIWDGGNGLIRVVSAATGKIQTVAGELQFGGDGGPGILAIFSSLGNIATDRAGNMYVADNGNNRIRKISPSGIITTIAGTGIKGTSGDGGKALQAAITLNTVLTCDSAGNVYFENLLDNGNTIRKVDTSGSISTIAGGGTAALGSGKQAVSVGIPFAPALAADDSGNVFFSYINQVFKVDPSGKISLVAGNGQEGSGTDGDLAIISSLGTVTSLAVDRSGLLYIGDEDFGQIKMVDAQGVLNPIAGTGRLAGPSATYTSGPATSVSLQEPFNLAVDSSGNVYFASEEFSARTQLVMVDTTGTLTGIGNQSPGNTNGDGGDSTKASFYVNGLTVDAAGDIFVSDGGAYIRKLAPYDPAKPPPYLSDGGVVGAAGSFPAVQAVSANGEVTLYGANFIAAGTFHNLQQADLVDGKVPTSLAGVCVNFGGLPAAILAVYPQQINVQVGALPPGPIAAQVTTNCGATNQIMSNPAPVIAQPASPEFYSFQPDPVAGKNPIAAVNLTTGAYVGPPGLLAGVTFAQAKAGDIVEAYGTGWGATTPDFGLGVLPGAAGSLNLPSSLVLGGVPLPAANVLYTGISPCCAGFYQVDFKVPAGTPSGNQPLVITIGGIPSPPQAYVAITQ